MIWGIVLEGLGTCFGTLGGSCGASWAVLAASWGVWAASWDVLAEFGESWRRLGASWAVLGRHGSIFAVLSSTGPGRPRASKKGPNMAPEMGAKTEQNRRQKRRGKKIPFEIVLKRSWSHLGSICGPISGQKNVFCLWFFPCFLKINIFEKVRCQEATWAELGPTSAPKRIQIGSQKASQDGAKKEKKSEVKRREVKSGK